METLVWNPTALLGRHPLDRPLTYSHVTPCLVPLRGRRHIGLRWFNGSSFKIGNKLGMTICAAGVVREINENQFSEVVLRSESPVLVEFVANWCGPCRLISPAIQWIAQEYKDKLTIVKIDHDSSPTLIEKYKVYGLPALILFKNGQEIPDSRREGAITKVKLKEYIDALLDSVSVSVSVS